MTDDDKIELGGLCAGLLLHPAFDQLCAEFDKSTVQAFLATHPTDAKGREAIYSQHQGAQQFIGFMATLVQAKDQLLAPPDDAQDY